MQQQQLAMLEDAMNTRKRIDALTEETDRLKMKLSARTEILNRLQKLSLASASLLGSVDSSSTNTEMSSLQFLSKLDQSTAVNNTNDETEDDQLKLIVGKYLNQILAVLVSFSEENSGNLNILSLMQIENKLNQLFAFAEQKEIIPVTEATESWKKGMAQHQQLFDKINSIFNQAEEETNEEEPK
ncbi:hypothetical protein TRFO_14169 [Tritrichomonas foetus]|uniref:Uncharacterized protein n=1 Tax=Tritrichomonas foetus TaxID=1144522 RepID=A0A1J4KVR3_9EUKA|nr:hypothetical protein TRFO_14169 [Tritrichomonas foetus]|eukprot:OHT15401.1 hypothetical protein TRFO_14169 [Tritrichomonas foetus]